MVNYCKSQKCLTGKTAIVTGANTGLGYATALDLAKRGCRVILACRNQEKASAAQEKITQITGNTNVVVKILDLEHLSSVKTFARDVNETEARLDILVNNAGVPDLPHRITEDGLQIVMTVNYFSHFLLTNLLLELLKKSAPSRIVNVSSLAARFVRNLKLEDLNKPAWWFWLYGRSKLCQIYFTQELAERLKERNVAVYSVHPGAIATDFQRDFSLLGKWVSYLTCKSPEEGCQTILHCALEDGLEESSGQHFDNCKVVGPYAGARDEDKRRKLWDLSEKLVGLKQASP